ncbi:Crp/Fnr family transcriptional regulator [Egicoccus sp. AB-alg6-2]|uniref:Crp/Fnr family transcriptional regulator n=1 Tax=Egicoccus sp. AB-alg6-2 TaxID=3242692 RepID=UPI00359E0CC9
MSAARASSLLGALGGDDLSAVLGAARVVRHVRREVVLRRADDAALVVLRGAAKEHRTNLDGLQVLTNVLGPGDVGGLTTALGYPGGNDVTALERFEGLVLRGRDLRDLAASRPPVAQACLRTVTEQYADLHERSVAFAGTSTTRRIVHRLLELATRWGQPVDGVVMVRLHLTQEELASWAGVSRESLAKVLGELRRAHILHTGRRELIIRDLSALQARQRSNGTAASVIDVLLADAGSDEPRTAGQRR